MGRARPGSGCLRGRNALGWAPLAVSLAGHLALVAGLLAIGVRALPDVAVDAGAVTLVVLATPQAAVVPAQVAPAVPPVPPAAAPEPVTDDLPLPPAPPPAMPPMPRPAPASIPRAAPPPAAAPLVAAPSAIMSATPGPAAIANWQQAVAAWLDAHQTYPEAARRRGEEGVATLRFLLQPDGTVGGLALLHGSGFTTLDEAALALLAGARLPAPPPGTPEARRWITVPLGYRLARPL